MATPPSPAASVCITVCWMRSTTASTRPRLTTPYTPTADSHHRNRRQSHRRHRTRLALHGRLGDPYTHTAGLRSEDRAAACSSHLAHHRLHRLAQLPSDTEWRPQRASLHIGQRTGLLPRRRHAHHTGRACEGRTLPWPIPPPGGRAARATTTPWSSICARTSVTDSNCVETTPGRRTWTTAPPGTPRSPPIRRRSSKSRRCPTWTTARLRRTSATSHPSTRTYELPFGKNKALFGNAGERTDRFVSGWSVASIATALSGFPFSPQLGL